MVKKPVEEPKGWPLKRPLTDVEWRQVQKALVVRRVSEGRSISKQKLIGFVQDDLEAAREGNKIYVEANPYAGNVYAGSVIEELIRHEILREGVVGFDHRAQEVKHIFRTEQADVFMGLLPKHIEAVLNFMPVTNELELLASLTPQDDLPEMEPPKDIFGNEVDDPFFI